MYFKHNWDEPPQDYDDTVLMFSNSVVEDGSQSSKLCEELRTDHLNSEERFSLIKISVNTMMYFTYQETN